jgi:DNA-binding beta-propeller fold protein YncE
MILKFTKDGKFVMMIGGPGGKGPDSNNKNGGRNGTPLFYLPADITVDPTTNRMYVSDGYGNRRVVIVDAATGKYIGHFGAYGNNPIDDKAAAAAGDWMSDFNKGNMKPAFFRNPVHCVKISKEGLIYVCDRGNNRIQVFNGRDPNLGKECLNPAGEAGKCGFVKEQFVSIKTNNLPGTAVSMNFSTDAKQSCLYVGDNSNMTMYVLKRDTLEELGRLGRSGRETGEFHWLHQVSIDSHGNLYTAEVDTGKRIQKFIRYGEEGCSGTGRKIVGGVLP